MGFLSMLIQYAPAQFAVLVPNDQPSVLTWMSLLMKTIQMLILLVVMDQTDFEQ